MRRSRSFHGLVVEHACAPLPGDDLERLLDAFPSASGFPTDIVISGRCVGRDVHLRERWRNLDPVFYLGKMQAWRLAAGYLLTDGHSMVEVDTVARTIQVEAACEAHEQVPAYVKGMKHMALGLLLREFGIFAVHAAAVVAQNVGIVIPGDCGSGKTTVALALVEAGCLYLGDDRVLLRRGTSGVELLAYPREFHVGPATADAFPAWRHAIDSQGVYDGKLALDPRQAFPDALQRDWVGPTLVWFPEVEPDRARSELVPVTQAEAFGRLLGSAALTLVDGIRHAEQHLAVLRALVLRSSSFRLLLGADLLSEPSRTASRLLGQAALHASRAVAERQ